jgi:hypothetical protein
MRTRVLDRLLRDGTAKARSDGSVHRLFPVAVGPAEGAAIRSWVIAEAAIRTIEVGLGYGISALFVCEGLLANGAPDARHLVIDPHQVTRFAGCGLQFPDEAGVGSLVKYHAGESQIALPRLVSQGCRFDLAVVDGNHRFDAVFVDLYYWGGCCARARSCSSTTTTCRASRGRSPSSWRIWAGRWKRFRPPKTATIGLSCAQAPNPTPGPSITSPISDGWAPAGLCALEECGARRPSATPLSAGYVGKGMRGCFRILAQWGCAATRVS